MVVSCNLSELKLSHEAAAAAVDANTSAMASRAIALMGFILANLAREVLRIICTPLSVVDGNLRIRAQRPSSVRFAAGHVRRHDPVRSLALFHPLLQGREHIKIAGSFAALAVTH